MPDTNGKDKGKKVKKFELSSADEAEENTLSEMFLMEAKVTEVKVDDSRATETKTVASNDSASAQTTGKNNSIIIVNIIFPNVFPLRRFHK